MRLLVFLLAVVAAYSIWRLQSPVGPYVKVVPIERRAPLKIEVVERTRT